MTVTLSPTQALLEAEKLLMTPLRTPKSDPDTREREEFERRRKAADLIADVRIDLGRRGIE